MAKIIEVTAIDATMNVSLREINTRLIKEGYELICVCSKGKNTQKLREEGFNVININIDRSIKPLSNIKSIYEMYRLFKREKPDIIHVHTPIAAVLGRIAASFAKVPITVYTAHGFYFHENMYKFKYKIFLNIEKYMAKYFTDYIFTQSDEDRITALRNKFIEENKISTIGNGVDIWEKLNPKKIDKNEVEKLYMEFDLKKEYKIVTFIGRLVKEKGVLDLLEAFNYIEDNNIKLLIIGDISQGSRDEKTKELMEKYKKNQNIIFTGYRGDIKNILHITDIFCLPSYREGMPRSIIEAMAMECAVIATNIRGSREEVVNDITGFLIDIGSAKLISERIKRLVVDDSLLRTMKLEGRKRAELLFDEKKVVAKQLKVFKQLLSYKAKEVEKQLRTSSSSS